MENASAVYSLYVPENGFFALLHRPRRPLAKLFCSELLHCFGLLHAPHQQFGLRMPKRSSCLDLPLLQNKRAAANLDATWPLDFNTCAKHRRSIVCTCLPHANQIRLHITASWLLPVDCRSGFVYNDVLHQALNLPHSHRCILPRPQVEVQHERL